MYSEAIRWTFNFSWHLCRINGNLVLAGVRWKAEEELDNHYAHDRRKRE